MFPLLLNLGLDAASRMSEPVSEGQKSSNDFVEAAGQRPNLMEEEQVISLSFYELTR